MADETWKSVKSNIEHYSTSLGPYFAHQALESPRHLLFTYSRYKFARSMLPVTGGSRVLELGCNEGLCSLMLMERASHLTAVDFDSQAVAHAQAHIEHDDIDFICRDFLGETLGCYDAVISLDVIEHIAPEKEALFFDTIDQNLERDGICLIGTPNATAAAHASRESQLGHVNLFTAERLEAAMQERFRNVFMFGMNDEVLHTGFFPMCHYLFALGSCRR